MRRWIGTLEFAERCITLHDVPFRASAFPWLIDIARTIDRTRGGVFILRFPPQVFKSLFGQLLLARTVAVEPCPSLWYAVTGTEAGAFWDSKLSRLLDSCDAVQRKRFDDPDARGGRTIFKQPDMTFEMLGADNRNHRNSKSARDILMDESWQYEAGALREIIKRSDSYETSRRIVLMTTGPSVDDDTDSLWEQSTKMEWRVACPSCEAAVPCVFGEAEDVGGIKWDSNEDTRDPGGRWLVSKAASTAVWVCPSCGGRHKYDTATQARMNDPKRGAGYVQTNETPSANVFGWTAEATVFRNWEGLVSEWLNACNAKSLGDLSNVEDFIRKARCKAWDPARMIKVNKTIPFGEYLMGDEWADEGKDAEGNPLRFMCVDVQKDHYWVVVRSWSNGGFRVSFSCESITNPAKLLAAIRSAERPVDVLVSSHLAQVSGKENSINSSAKSEIACALNRLICLGDLSELASFEGIQRTEAGLQKAKSIQQKNRQLLADAYIGCLTHSDSLPTFAHSRLLHFEKAFSHLQIEEIRQRLNVLPNRVTMDCKWNDQAVYQICHRYGYTAFAGVDVKGNSFLHGDGVRRIYDEPRYMDAYAGKLEAGTSFALRIQFSSIAAKFRLEMMRQSKDPSGNPVWTVPKDAPPEYLKQAWGEVMIRKRNPKGGWRTEFKEVGPNHAFDMESVQGVCASIVGILGAEALVEQAEGEE